jgi:topoisomerase-4 subunit A
LAIKGRDSRGNLVTKYAVKKVDLKEEGVSTLAPRKIWFDDTVRRLNADGRGTLLGSFKGDDKILTINQNGEAKLVTLTCNRFDDEYLILENGSQNSRLRVSILMAKKEFISSNVSCWKTLQMFSILCQVNIRNLLEFVGTSDGCTAEIIFAKDKSGKEKEPEIINIDEFIAVKGIKAIGNQFIKEKVKSINITIPEPLKKKLLKQRNLKVKKLMQILKLMKFRRRSNRRFILH